MKVIEIVASIANESHGPSYSVPRLAESLAAAGADVELHTVGEPGDELRQGVRRRTFAHDLGSVPRIGHLRLSGDLRRGLRDGAKSADVLHTHGLWLAPNIYPAQAAALAGRAFVVSPRGMLGAPALRFSRLQKRAVWALFQRRALASAALIHATSEDEMEAVRAMGLGNPVAVIPNGIDIPPIGPRPPAPERVVLALGRIHPKKGLDRLVRAWSILAALTSGWRLRIVGPDEGGHAEDLRALAVELGLANVDIEPPLFGADKLAAYRAATLFVLPTLNENFAMTVAESLAAGVPVIATHGAPWSGLVEERCGWWIEHGEASLARALKDAMLTPRQTLEAMGWRGRDWMARDFSWDRIGADMLEAYRWAVDGGPPPGTIRL